MSVRFLKKAGLFWLGLMVLVTVLVAAFDPAPPKVAAVSTVTATPSVKAAQYDKQRADPQTVQIDGTDRADAKDAVAALINLNGHLCAEPVDVRPLKVRQSAFEVTCIEYRGGSGRVRYIVDAASGTAWPASATN